MMKLAFALALTAIGTTQRSTQPENCAPTERRVAAIRYARQINTAEAATFRAHRGDTNRWHSSE